MDRAALDAALRLGLPCGGWCPAGRRAEDGPIPLRYPLRETHSADPAERTARNVRDSDATLLLATLPLRGGTALTAALARRCGRPLALFDPWGAKPTAVATWVRGVAPRRLNVAGPRESEAPGIGRAALHLLLAALPPASGAGVRR